MKKILLIISFALLLLVGCGKPKIKTYTMAEKEAYLEKANNGDDEAREYVQARIEEYEKIYKETNSAIARKEFEEWTKIAFQFNREFPVIPPAW